MDKSIQEYFEDVLSQPMNIRGREGATIMPADAMAKAVVNNAAKGDVPSILFLQNMTRKPDPEADRQRKADRDAALKINRDRLAQSLKDDDLYAPAIDIELDALAQTLTLISEIDRQMQQPGFQDLITDFRKDGTTVPRLNPLHELRDKYRQQFKKEWQELRNDALRRKMMRK